jgi:catechol 2,3-dioxygenase-like lactoylglutathione lyase family enzyme
MSSYIISGIQQIGIGVSNVHQAWQWYRQAFGMDVPIFEEEAEANLMLPYTGGKGWSRHAILAVNLQGGGGFEIWQYTGRTSEPSKFEITLGDYGIYAAKIKSRDVRKTYKIFQEKGYNLVSEVVKDPAGHDHFFLKDPFDNLFQVVPSDTWFGQTASLTGGPYGCIIGVSDIEKSRKLYSDILGYDLVIYDKEGKNEDLASLPGGNHSFHRVLLTHSQPRKGGFSKLLGPSQIELVSLQNTSVSPRKIYENRFWGDLGFIHLCFDIIGMKAMEEKCKANGFPFTIDSSNSFDMGEAAGHFSYIEDPDGTLIEFVETHKIPIMKKLGWYLDLRKRNPEKPLPNWMLKALGLNRVKG